MYCVNLLRLQSTFSAGKLVLYHYTEKHFVNTVFQIMNIISWGNLGRVHGYTIHGNGDYEIVLA